MAKIARVKIKESDLQRQIIDFINIQPRLFCWRAPSRGVFDVQRGVFRTSDTIRGISDILGLVKSSGRLFAIELKAPGRPRRGSPEQELFLAKIKSMGGLSGVARSIEEVVEILKQDHSTGL